MRPDCYQDSGLMRVLNLRQKGTDSSIGSLVGSNFGDQRFLRSKQGTKRLRMV